MILQLSPSPQETGQSVGSTRSCNKTMKNVPCYKMKMSIFSLLLVLQFGVCGTLTRVLVCHFWLFESKNYIVSPLQLVWLLAVEYLYTLIGKKKSNLIINKLFIYFSSISDVLSSINKASHRIQLLAATSEI